MTRMVSKECLFFSKPSGGIPFHKNMMVHGSILLYQNLKALCLSITFAIACY